MTMTQQLSGISRVLYWLITQRLLMLHLSLKRDHVMQTTNDIFVNPSAIKTKIAGKLVDDTEQVSGKTKLLGVKREQNPP